MGAAKRVTRRRFLHAAAIGAGGLAVQACVSGQPSGAPPSTAAASNAGVTPKRGGTFTAAIVNDWVTGDDIFPVLDTLVFLKPDDKGAWRPVPGLIERWENPDPKTFVFFLRRGVKFHDGSDFDAPYLKWNFDVWMKEKPTNERAAARKDVLEGIDVNAPATVVDDYTMKLHLTRPVPNLLDSLAFSGNSVGVMSKVHYEKVGPEQAVRTPIGTGPFQLVEWRPSDRVILKRNENYWMKGADGKALPYLDGMTIRRIVDDSVRVIELQSENLNFGELLPSRQLRALKADPKLTVLDGPWCGQQYRMVFNARAGAFAKDLKLRQAALAAIDRETIAKTVGGESGAVARYFLLPGTMGYDETLPSHDFDLEKARRLMKESTRPEGVEITFAVVSRELDKLTAEAVAQMWSKIGIRAKIDLLERAAWVKRLTSGQDYDAGVMRNPMTAADPDLFMRVILHSKGFFNTAHVASKEIDDALDRAAGTYDVSARAAAYREAQKADYDQAYYGYIWNQKWNWVFSRRLKGVPPPMRDDWDFRTAWIDS